MDKYVETLDALMKAKKEKKKKENKLGNFERIKKKSKEELDIDDSLDLNDEEESSGGNKLLNAFIVVVVIAIWLVIFGYLIKIKIGGIGSILIQFLKNLKYN